MPTPNLKIPITKDDSFDDIMDKMELMSWRREVLTKQEVLDRYGHLLTKNQKQQHKLKHDLK